ncbi:hypothetical protein H0A70_03965 [Alcaligenaceae bacterium]|nr:hypothetical protein [Alcaligenaceae bacterium]
MTKRAFWLSKSKIMSGRQCAKRLWLETHCREHAEVSHATQMTYDHGHMFGDIARSLIGEGPLIEHVDDIGLTISETKNLMRSNRTLFEPAF